MPANQDETMTTPITGTMESTVQHMDTQEFAEFVGLTPEGFPKEPGAPAAEHTPEKAPDPARDPESGQFVKEDDAPVTEAPVPEGTAPPEGESTPLLPTDKPMLTKFSVHDPDGELEIPDLRFTFQGDGKTYDQIPVDKVIAMAQQQAGLARLHQEALSGKQSAEFQTQQAHFEAQRITAQYEAAIASMLTDPDVHRAAVERYAASVHPAKIAQEKVQQLEAQRQYTHDQQVGTAVAQFVQTVAAPALTFLEQQYPSVPGEDVLMRYNAGIGPYLVQGRVPAEHLAQVHQIVLQQTAEWAALRHQAATDAASSATAQRQKEQATTQAKQREVGRALKPVGTAPDVVPPPLGAPRPQSAKAVRDMSNEDFARWIQFPT